MEGTMQHIEPYLIVAVSSAIVAIIAYITFVKSTVHRRVRAAVSQQYRED
jgi:hypothetical protein